MWKCVTKLQLNWSRCFLVPNRTISPKNPESVIWMHAQPMVINTRNLQSWAYSPAVQLIGDKKNSGPLERSRTRSNNFGSTKREWRDVSIVRLSSIWCRISNLLNWYYLTLLQVILHYHVSMIPLRGNAYDFQPSKPLLRRNDDGMVCRPLFITESAGVIAKKFCFYLKY